MFSVFKMEFFMLIFTLSVFATGFGSQNFSPTPVVIWHGMGDSCCSTGITKIVKTIQANISGIFVHSIEIGNSPDEDSSNSYFDVVNNQIDQVCKNLSRIPELKNGYHAIGLSQGSQFLRAVAQRCPNPPMINLISIGGQHQGVNALPNCGGSSVTCNAVRKLLDLGVYTNFVQNRLVQAQYWHDSLKEDVYRKESLFLADVNNEVAKNQNYKTNLQKINRFVMVRFLKDTSVYPQESEWFGYYCPGSITKVCPLRNSTLYTEDWLGLKQMDQGGQLVFLTVDADHLQFTIQWFLDQIVAPFLH